MSRARRDKSGVLSERLVLRTCGCGQGDDSQSAGCSRECAARKRTKNAEVVVAIPRGAIEVKHGMVLRFFFSKLVSGDLENEDLMPFEAFCVVGLFRHDHSSCVFC